MSYNHMIVNSSGRGQGGAGEGAASGAESAEGREEGEKKATHDWPKTTEQFVRSIANHLTHSEKDRTD